MSLSDGQDQLTSPHALGRRLLILLMMTGLPAMIALAEPSPASSSQTKDEQRGVVLDALRPDRGCDGYRVEIPNLPDSCTHGPDPAPRGEDVRERRSVSELRSEAPADASTAGSVPCVGDGSSGDRVEVIYARASDVPDRYAQVAPLIEQWASDLDDRVRESAAESGGVRSVRFVTSSCKLVVRNVVLSTRGDDDIGQTASDLAARGYNRADRKYLTFVESTVYCGIGFWPGNVARIDQNCWNGGVALHEVMHNFGAVDLSAPNSSGGGHCTDQAEVMCYSDEPYKPAMRQVCPPAHQRLLDCGGDDYFNAAPPAGSFLSARPELNTADSPFLVERDAQVSVYLPPTPASYQGPRYRARAFNADDDECVYGVRGASGERVRLFCVGYRGDREADVTGALLALAGTTRSARLQLVATDRGGGRSYGFTVRRDGATVLDERDGEAGRSSSSAPLGPADPLTGWPVFYDRTLTLSVNQPPSASFTVSPGSPRAGDRVTLSSTSTDPEGAIARQEWDLDADGQFDDASGATATWVFPSAGTYRVSLRVTDDAGASADASRTLTVAVTPTPPPSGGGSATPTPPPGGSGSPWSATGGSTSAGTPFGQGASTPTAGTENPSCRTATRTLDDASLRLAQLQRGLSGEYRRLRRWYRRLRRSGSPASRVRRYTRALRAFQRRQRAARRIERQIAGLEQAVERSCP